MKITFTVPAVPVAQPRPRAVRMGNSARVHEVTHIKGEDGQRRPHPIIHFRAMVAQVAADVYPLPPLKGPLAVTLVFVMPRPAAKMWERKPMVREWQAKRPDADNMAKAVLDALAMIWKDDGQVCDLSVRKVVASGYEQPHVEVAIEQLTKEPAQPEGEHS